VNAHKFNQWHPVSAPLPLAEKQALALRDLVVVVAKAKGVSLSTNQPADLYTYHDARIRMEYSIVGSTFMIASEGKAPWVTDEHHGDAKQPLTHGNQQSSALYMAGCIAIPRVVMLPVALLTGRFADHIGRKPLFLIGFAAIAIRGVLFSLGEGPVYLIAVQALDGIGIGIFGVVATLMTADLARGTGRFNFLQGAIAACWSFGVFASNVLFGGVANHFGFSASFLGLAAVAILGFAFFLLLMPETKDLSRDPGSDVVLEIQSHAARDTATPEP
jgi:MFS family permease